MFQAMLKIKDATQRQRVINLEWFINSEALPADINYIEILHFYASDAELKFVYDNFDNIPMPLKGTSCLWKGEFSRFLFDNICLLNKS